MSNSLWPHGLYIWNSLGQNPREGGFSFSRVSSQPRDWTQISHIAGRFFTSWATREALPRNTLNKHQPQSVQMRTNHAVSSYPLSPHALHIYPTSGEWAELIFRPEFVNSATRPCLECYKNSIPWKSVLLTDSCWVDGVERQRRNHLDQFPAQHLWKPLLFQTSLNKCWPTETPGGHDLYGSEGWWKHLGLMWWQIQHHTPPHSKEPPSHIFHWQAVSLPELPQIACVPHNLFPEGSVLPNESSWQNDSLPNNF